MCWRDQTLYNYDLVACPVYLAAGNGICNKFQILQIVRSENLNWTRTHEHNSAHETQMILKTLNKLFIWWPQPREVTQPMIFIKTSIWKIFAQGLMNPQLTLFYKKQKSDYLWILFNTYFVKSLVHVKWEIQQIPEEQAGVKTRAVVSTGLKTRVCFPHWREMLKLLTRPEIYLLVAEVTGLL